MVITSANLGLALTAAGRYDEALGAFTEARETARARGGAGIMPMLARAEDVYNTVRPHQALAYQTPLAWLQDHQKQKTDHSQMATAHSPLPKADSSTIKGHHV